MEWSTRVNPLSTNLESFVSKGILVHDPRHLTTITHCMKVQYVSNSARPLQEIFKSVNLLYCIEGVVTAAQFTATFSDLFCFPELSITRT